MKIATVLLSSLVVLPGLAAGVTLAADAPKPMRHKACVNCA